MRYLLTGLAGLVLGALAAATVVYFNPLTGNRAAPAAAPEAWRLGYAFPEPGVLAHTHGGRFPSPRVPAGSRELWEETIRSSALTTMRLTDSRDGGPAWATRISVPSGRTNLMLNGIVFSDHWLISKPGQGSMFLSAYTNLWPALKDTYLRVDLLGRPWQGPATYSPTLPAEGSPLLLGATGRFAGLEGRGVETFELAAYDATAGIGSLRGRLTLELERSETPAPAAAEGTAAP